MPKHAAPYDDTKDRIARRHMAEQGYLMGAFYRSIGKHHPAQDAIL